MKSKVKIFSVFLLNYLLYGGITGKLTGTIKDKDTGEPLIGCNVISADKLSFKHSLIKSGFFSLIFLNSGRYLPACLINHIGV